MPASCIQVCSQKKAYKRSLKSKKNDVRHMVASETVSYFTLKHKQQKEVREKPPNIKIFSENFVMNQVCTMKKAK